MQLIVDALAIVSVAFECWVFYRTGRLLRSGHHGRLRVAVGSAALAWLPSLFVIGALVAAIGIEEWTDRSVLGERFILICAPFFIESAAGSVAVLLRCAASRSIKTINHLQ